MIKDGRCVKVGCDLVHGETSWHGDLHYGDGVGFLFFPSSRNAYGMTEEYLKHYFVCEDVAMFGDETIFVPLKVVKVSESMVDNLRKYGEDRVCQLLQNLGKESDQ